MALSNISNIGKGAIISYVSIFLNIIISFVYTPWMLNRIGASDYGLYSLINSFIAYFIIDFGLSSAIARFVAKYRAEGNNTKVENILGLTLRIFFAIDVVIFLCLFICYFFIADIFTGLTPAEIERLKVLYIIASTFSLLSFGLKPLDGALTAYEYFVPAKIIDMVYKVGSVLFVVIALLLGGNIYILVLINGGLSFLTHLYRFIYWHKKTGLFPNLLFQDKTEARSIFSFSGWTFLIGMAQRFRLNLIPSVLGIFANSVEIAVFSLGMTMEAMTYTLSSALNGLFLPMVSRLVYNDDQRGIMDLMIKVGRIQLFVVFAIFSGFFVCGQTFINLWVGETYSDVYYIVLCLISSNIISNTLQVATDKVYAENKIKYTARVTFTTSLVGIVVSCCVAGKFGAVGCAACSGVALVVSQICYMRIYKKRLDIDIAGFFRACHLRIMPLITIIASIFFLAFQYLNIKSWAGLIFGVGIYIIVYALVSYFFLFNEYEKSLVKTILRIK